MILRADRRPELDRAFAAIGPTAFLGPSFSPGPAATAAEQARGVRIDLLAELDIEDAGGGRLGIVEPLIRRELLGLDRGPAAASGRRCQRQIDAA